MPLSSSYQKGILLSFPMLLKSFTWLGKTDPKGKFHQIILKVLSKDDKKCFSLYFNSAITIEVHRNVSAVNAECQLLAKLK